MSERLTGDPEQLAAIAEAERILRESRVERNTHHPFLESVKSLYQSHKPLFFASSCVIGVV